MRKTNVGQGTAQLNACLGFDNESLEVWLSSREPTQNLLLKSCECDSVVKSLLNSDRPALGLFPIPQKGKKKKFSLDYKVNSRVD